LGTKAKIAGRDGGQALVILESVRDAGAGRATLLCGAAILALLGAILLLNPGGRPAAGASNAASEPAATALDPDELARISVEVTPQVARRVERLRELRFEQVPHPRVVDSSFLNRLGERELERSGGTAGVHVDEAETRIVGLLDRSEQLEDAYGTTGDLAAAAYDTDTDRLYVIGDAVAPNRALIEFVIAHELNHALEDERFGLPRGEGSDDAALAAIALSEGTATSLMTDYGSEYIAPLDLLEGAAGLDAGTGDVPSFYVDQLLWAYTGGERFVAELRALGEGWKLVDYALASRPPVSTEQVIHPEKYLRDERPLEVSVNPAALDSGGWRRVDRGTLGELTTAQLLGVGAPEAEAAAGAAGWGGDEYGLWRRGPAVRDCPHPCRSDLVLVLSFAWDSPADVGEFASAVAAYAERGLDGTPAPNGVWAIEQGALALAAGETESALVFAPDEELAAEVAAEQLAR
jgi:hypothetical protein